MYPFICRNGNNQPTEKNHTSWKLSDSIGKAYNNLGIVLNNKAKLGDRISTACNKEWKSFHGLSDISITKVNPLTMSHLYKTVVLLLV